MGNYKEMGSQFGQLVKKLSKALKDSVKMQQYSYDPEMTSDLYYQVSTSYTESPDLRVAWLDNLFKIHNQAGRLEEAVQCKILISGLIAEFLHVQDQKAKIKCMAIPRGNAAFVSVSPNIAAERGIPPDIEHALDEGMYNADDFSLEGLQNHLRAAVITAKRAELPEMIISLYRYLVVISQEQRDFSTLAQCFRDLKGVCSGLATMGNMRFLGAFYRVAFYGKKWGADLNGHEYIYKEKGSVRIGDISTRLKTQYEPKHGAVELVSPTAGKKELIAKNDKCYIQVVAVQPHFSKEELLLRNSAWEHYYDTKRFVFSTPYTEGGKKRGGVGEQCTLKTVLTTEKAFPFVKNRLRITKVDEQKLSPIETALELIEGRCDALRTEKNQNPPNSKTLQLTLQGSVLITVNTGPMDIAKTFLGDPSKHPEKFTRALRKSLTVFVLLAFDVLRINRQIIEENQVDFQRELENGFLTLLKEMKDFTDTKIINDFELKNQAVLKSMGGKAPEEGSMISPQKNTRK
eukprot:TRINITY_DN7098_c0_g3_i1.p1 TRINITY_DN7098_c0_g3~~TRINITY_DN7098_c0_g3_i1.p1  ORF type:complete len:582 (-),score=133.57 TRINITY_DN7098_c0_g3_i1:77-1627(-)